jgi:hypothetical protein
MENIFTFDFVTGRILDRDSVYFWVFWVMLWKWKGIRGYDRVKKRRSSPRGTFFYLYFLFSFGRRTVILSWSCSFITAFKAYVPRMRPLNHNICTSWGSRRLTKGATITPCYDRVFTAVVYFVDTAHYECFVFFQACRGSLMTFGGKC